MAEGERYRHRRFPAAAAARKPASLSVRRRQPQPRPARKADDRAGAADAPFQHLARRRPSSASVARRALPAHGEAWTLGASSSSGSPGARSSSSARSCSSSRPRRRRACAPASSSPHSSASPRSRACGTSSAAPTSSSRGSSRCVRFEDYSQRFSDPSGGGFDVLGQTLDQALKTPAGAAHAGKRRGALSRRRSSTMRRARCSPSIRTGAIEVLNKAARQLFARHPLNRIERPRCARARACRRSSPAAGHAQDHSAGPRRRAAEGDLRFRPGRAPRPAGDRPLDPAGAERARRARGRGAGRPRARAHARDHEFADSGHLARADRAPSSSRRRPSATMRSATRRARPRRSPGAPKASCASSKAIANLRRRPTSTAASSRRSPGPRRSCALRSPMRPTARSTRGSRSSPRR